MQTAILCIPVTCALCGVVVAIVTLSSIVNEYCDAPWDEEQPCDDGLTTISYMSRVEPATSRLAGGMTTALLLMLPVP